MFARIAAIAMPTVKASSSADMTSSGAGISTLKYGEIAASSMSTAFTIEVPLSSHGYTAWDTPKAMRPEMTVDT